MKDAQLLQWLISVGFLTPTGRINGKRFQHVGNNPQIYNSIEWKFFNERTKFLGHVNTDQKIFVLERNIYTVPMCDHCKNKQVKFLCRSRGYQRFCCAKCAQTDPRIRKKQEDAMLEKYGVKHVTQSVELNQKRKETCLKRYGSDTPFQSNEIQQKVRDNTLEKYGVVSTALLPEIRVRQIKTRQEKYGVDFLFQSDAVQEQIEVNTRGRNNGKMLSQRHISNDTFLKLGNKEWMEEQYVTNKRSTTSISAELNVTDSTVSKYLRFHDIPVNTTQYRSTSEREIESFIRSIYSGPVITATKKVIHPQELDIYLPELHLAIEFNGLYWHREQHLGKSYHIDKTNKCASMGVRLIHIFEHEWINKREIVENRIKHLLGMSLRVFARNTQVVEITSKQSKLFFESTHIQGFVAGKVYLGLVYKDNIIAAMSFGKCRYSKTHQWELLRYSSTETVVGGASKLFKYFVSTQHPDSVISYADKRWSTGNLYKQLGFTELKDSNINYYYFHLQRDKYKLYHRSYFQKHKLSKLLTVFDPVLTEYQNMLNNGYDRIWDCGNKVFVWSQN
jgi:hypothetical protein